MAVAPGAYWEEALGWKLSLGFVRLLRCHVRLSQGWGNGQASSNPFCWGPFADSCWDLVVLLAAACSGELTAQPAPELGGPGVRLAEVWHRHETGWRHCPNPLAQTPLQGWASLLSCLPCFCYLYIRSIHNHPEGNTQLLVSFPLWCKERHEKGDWIRSHF